MNKKFMSALTIVTVTLFCVVAIAEALPLSSTHFNSVTILFYASGSATFSASLKKKCSSVGVSSCTLEKKDGNNWTFESMLPTPNSKTDTSFYAASQDYSAHLTSGVTYRLVVVYEADGEQVTKTSSSITYK